MVGRGHYNTRNYHSIREVENHCSQWMNPNINDHRLNDSSYLPALDGRTIEFGNSSFCLHAVLGLYVLGKSSTTELQTQLSGNAFASEKALANMEVVVL